MYKLPGPPLLLHRRRVPAAALQWQSQDAVPEVGPPAWFCRQCANKLRPAHRTVVGPGGCQPLPTLGMHMLANDNWGGQMPPELRELRVIEILMLQWMRPLRRRFFMNNHSGGIGMPATFGSSVVAPCATGIEQALRWTPNKIRLPVRPEELSEFVDFILPGNLHLPEGYTAEDLRTAILTTLTKHTWARARRKQLHAAARVLARMCPAGLVQIDEEYLSSLPDEAVPEGLADLVRIEDDGARATETTLAASGPADAGTLREKSAAEKAVDAGLAAMVQIPAESMEATDPVECAKEAEQKLRNAFKGTQQALSADKEFNREAQADELRHLSEKMAEALRDVARQAVKDDKAEATRLMDHVKDGAIVLPTGRNLASMWDPMTWAYAFMALFPHGDLVPYFDREVPMTLRETFAYLLAREELTYPMTDGSPPPPPLEPCRWANDPWEHACCSDCLNCSAA